MRPPSTGPRAPPSTGPTSTSTAAAENSPTSRCPEPAAPPPSTASPTTSIKPSRTSTATGATTAGNAGPSTPTCPPPPGKPPPRAPGATAARSHVDRAGGGRELTYVALSRARGTTTIHGVADNLDQAVEDLHRDWSHDRRQRWTLDTDLPAAPGQATRPSLLPSVDVGLRLGRLRAERTAILAAMPADPGPELAALAARRRDLDQPLEALPPGTGRYPGTYTGQEAAAFPDVEARAGANGR